MRRRASRSACLAGLIGLLGLWLGCAGPPRGASAVGRPETPVQLREDQIIVAVDRVDPDLVGREARRMSDFFELRFVSAFALPSIDVHCLVFEPDDPSRIDETLERIARHPGVLLAQRNREFRLRSAEAFPPRGGTARHDDDYAPLQHGATAIGADRAHRYETGRGVRVALVDSGVDRSHPDLEHSVRDSRSFVRAREAGASLEDHGTAVAGVIAARADNGIGIFGIAPEAELVSAKACWHADGSASPAVCSSWSIARALDYVIRQRVRIVNLSLAGDPDRLVSRLLREADSRGIAVVAAADGPGPALGYPASLPEVVAVAGWRMGTETGRAGAEPVSVILAPDDDILTTAPGASYRYVSGSSVAVAHVSGALALVFELEPDWSPRQAVELLRSTARSASGPDVASRARVLDAYAAIDRLRRESEDRARLGDESRARSVPDR